MMKRTLAFAVALAAAAAAAKPSTVVSVAPYEDVSAKTTEFGTLLGNPAIPALLLATLQRTMVSTYGKFRTDSPFYMLSYAGAAGSGDEAVVYPSTDGIARMALANPGSERQGADMLHLMPSRRKAHERFAVFSGDGRHVSFAQSEAVARRALADMPAPPSGSMPLISVSLDDSGVKAVCQSGRKAGVTNLVDAVERFSALDLSLDLGERGIVLSFSGPVRDAASAAGTAGLLESELRTMLSGIKGEDAKAAPEISAHPSADGSSVSGEAVVSKELLKGMGADFNSFVATQMAGAVSGGGKARTGKESKTRERGK